MLQQISSTIQNAAADLLSNNDFISRTIGMSNSYEDIMVLVQALGREPVSLLGKDFTFIYDHVRRNYIKGTEANTSINSDGTSSFYCTKFTFYKEKPTIRFANPMLDTQFLIDAWTPSVSFETTVQGHTLISYAESYNTVNNNITISARNENEGINYGKIQSFANTLDTCDMISKTNSNFKNGKYRTLIARFHTYADDDKSTDNITQTAISKTYGMSHGRNLLATSIDSSEGYDNPYCRVWTYHHQYNSLSRAIRPFSYINSASELEKEERGAYDSLSFRTTGNDDFGGGSSRLDEYGVLNYKNGMVNIAPKASISDYFKGLNDSKQSSEKATIKKCMFSIENLAWKSDNIRMNEYDQYGLSAEQKGPLGGRIMWFPPYDLTFSESVRVNWNANQFIGRGENIYTYTNTERSGNLSFMLLIDHPSIIDYWKGRSDSTQSSDYSVDATGSTENEILRFFAGCSILTAKPQYYYHTVFSNPKTPEVKEEIVKPTPKTTKKAIHCVLYYPNNYSGVNDMPTSNNSTVNAIYYLANGVGTQKYVNSKKDAEDIPTTIDNLPVCHYEGGLLVSGYKGGYEMGKNSNMGISISVQNLDANYDTIAGTYADLTTNVRHAQYLTTDANVRYIAQYGNGQQYTLAKLIGSQAMSLNAAKTKSNLTGASHLWYRRRWYYRVDKAYENDRLSTTKSYLDTNDFGLNGSGYKAILSETNIAQAFGLDTTDPNVTLISFTDMFVALEGNKARDVVSGIDEANVKLVQAIMNNKDQYNITAIRFEGHASYQGYAASNNDLSKNRAVTFKKWMQAKGFPSMDKATTGTKKESQRNNVDKGENSEKTVKMWRSASVIIEYEETEVMNASDADSSTVSQGSGGTYNDSLVKMEIPNKNASKRTNVTTTPQQTSGSSAPKQSSTITIGTVGRYDNEGEFFQALDKTSPFLHHLITEKIKYFDPAFHSISPEGFNARLTFLQQCTRQGSTVSGSDTISSTAYNLAFGRPPVCVLRIGDFYYTKIIINNLDIQFEQPQWDLNPEGIGVMPMFAKVTLSFVFLGGSDLAGPISRLQNAVSFNYYANTGVYDNRAEMVKYDSEGKGREVKFKPFSYPNMVYENDANK